MIRVCSGCKTVLGEKPPLDDPSETHGICRSCAAELYGEATARRFFGELSPPPAVAEIPDERRPDMLLTWVSLPGGRVRCTLCNVELDPADLPRHELTAGHLSRLAELTVQAQRRAG